MSTLSISRVFSWLRHFKYLIVSGVKSCWSLICWGLKAAKPYATIITALAALLTALILGIQTCSLIEQLELSLSVTRPIVLLRPAKNKRLTKWGYDAVNSSSYPARIIAKNLKIQIGNEHIASSTAPIHVLVSQGNDISVGIEVASAQEAKNIRNGKIIVQMEACIIYRSIIKDDPRHWQATSKDVYNIQAGAFAVKFRDTWSVSPNTEQCVVELSPEKR